MRVHWFNEWDSSARLNVSLIRLDVYRYWECYVHGDEWEISFVLFGFGVQVVW